MPRDHGMNIYYECDITDWCVNMSSFMSWCDQYLEGNWNIVADSGGQAARGSGVHVVIFLCDKLEDMTAVKLHWQ